MLSKELLSILACPICKAGVKPEEEFMVCVKCSRRYPVKDGIPIMLTEESFEPASGEKASRGNG